MKLQGNGSYTIENKSHFDRKKEEIESQVCCSWENMSARVQEALKLTGYFPRCHHLQATSSVSLHFIIKVLKVFGGTTFYNYLGFLLTSSNSY